MTAVVALPGDGGIAHKLKFCKQKRTKNIASMGKTDLLSLFFFDPLHPSLDDLYFPLKTSTIITESQPEPQATPDNCLPPSPTTDVEEQHTDPADLSEDSLHDEVDTSSNVTDCECGWACVGPCNSDFEMWEEDYISEEYNWWDEECLTRREVRSFELEEEWEANQRTKAQRTGKEGLRAKRSDKKDKVWHTRYVRSVCLKKKEANDAAISQHFENQKNNSNNRTKFYNNFGSTYTTTNRYTNHRDESAEVQRAIALSLSTNNHNHNNNLACGLTQRQLNDLMNRELTPEDYEMLLRLDDSVAKKTVATSALDRFGSRAVTAADVEESACTICLSEYVIGETLKILPCGHFFHENCVREWLSKSSVNCPIDNLPVNAS